MRRRLVAQHGTKKWAHLATIIKSKKSKQVWRCTATSSFTPLVLYAAQLACTEMSYNHPHTFTHKRIL